MADPFHPTSLAGLLVDLAARARGGVSRQAILESLHGILTRNAVRLRHDGYIPDGGASPEQPIDSTESNLFVCGRTPVQFSMDSPPANNDTPAGSSGGAGGDEDGGVAAEAAPPQPVPASARESPGTQPAFLPFGPGSFPSLEDSMAALDKGPHQGRRLGRRSGRDVEHRKDGPIMVGSVIVASPQVVPAQSAGGKAAERRVVRLADPSLLVHIAQDAPPKTDPAGHIGRVIMSCGRRVEVPEPMSARLCYECNGVVVDARTWLPLSIPPRAFNVDARSAQVDAWLGRDVYDIIPANDGTIVTLYPWNHPRKGTIWCISTAKGYDVSPFKWMGNKTYAELLFELLNGASYAGVRCVQATGLRLLRDFLCPGDVRLHFSDLPLGRCYTVRFRHPAFHPLYKDPPGIWNIQSVDLGLAAAGVEHAIAFSHVSGDAADSASDEVGCADAADLSAGGVPRDPHRKNAAAAGPILMIPGVPPQDVCRPLELLAIARSRASAALSTSLVPKGARASFTALVRGGRTRLEYGDLLLIHRRALEDAFGSTAAARPATAATFNYGYILRSRDPARTGDHSDILCESDLLRQVRRLVYRRPPLEQRENVDYHTRLDYSAMRAFLSATDCGTFLRLFPQYKEPFALYQNFADNIIRLIVQIRRQLTMAPDGGENAHADRPPGSAAAALARALHDHIVSCERNIPPWNANFEEIVRDYTIRPEYALVYLTALRRQGRRRGISTRPDSAASSAASDLLSANVAPGPVPAPVPAPAPAPAPPGTTEEGGAL